MPENPLLYLVRHGQTEANVAERFVGWSDDRLSERGREQARELAARLGSGGVARIFSSPVRRCVETAEILSGELEVEVRTVHGIHEIVVGPWKGLTAEDVRGRWPEEYRVFLDRPDEFRLQGRETLQEVRNRAVEAIDRVAHSLLGGPERPAVVVTHLAVIRVLWLGAQGRPLAEYHRVKGPFCEIFPVRWTGRGRLEAAGPPPPEAAS